jgi:hypothetical protein
MLPVKPLQASVKANKFARQRGSLLYDSQAEDFSCCGVIALAKRGKRLFTPPRKSSGETFMDSYLSRSVRIPRQSEALMSAIFPETSTP